jgi:hypothetical protein
LIAAPLTIRAASRPEFLLPCIQWLAVGGYWTDDVQEAFEQRRNAAGSVDRDTFLHLLQEQQRRRKAQKPQAGAEGDGDSDDDSGNALGTALRPAASQGAADAGQANTFQRKRPQLSLKLGVGAAAGGGAVKLGFECVVRAGVRAYVRGHLPLASAVDA